MKYPIKANLNYIIWGLVAFCMFLAPLLRLVAMSFTTNAGFGIDGYITLLSETRTIRSIKNTIIIGAGSTTISLLIGCSAAFIVAYTDIKRKNLLHALMLAPFVIPSYIITLSWSGMLSARGELNAIINNLLGFKINIYSMGGIIAVLGICNATLVYLNFLPTLRKIPQDQEWASRVSGHSLFQTMKQINFKQAAPAIASGGALAFLAAVDNFSIPAFLGIPAGIPVLSTYIYENVISFGPSSFSKAAVLSVILSFIALAGTLLQGIIVRKSFIGESIKEDTSVRIALGKKRRILECGFIFSLLVLNIVPLITMIVSSFFPAFGEKTLDRFTLENYAFVFTNRGVQKAFINSLALATATCVICIIAGTAIAYIKVRKNSTAIKLVEQSAALTYALPGIVLALAMIFHWTSVRNVYGTVKILLIAYVTRYLILQIKSSSNALLSINPALEEASEVFGSSKLRTWFKIILPLCSKAILSGTFLIFMQSLTELTLSSMLAAAGSRTIGLTIFSLQQGGDYQRAAAVSSVIVGVVALFYIASSVFSKNKINLKENEE